MKRSRKVDERQLDLFAWADARPTAKVLSIIPGLARRMWAERHKEQPNNPPHILPWRRQA